MSQEYPRISIVTPSFNQANFLERTIQSVLNQDYPNLEYIIIDGSSTDGSVEMIRKYESRLAYWVSEKDRGQAHALNKGFKQATGEIVAWLNSDDMYPPDTFQAIAEEFCKNPELDIVYGNVYSVDESDNIIWKSKYTKVWYPMLPLIGCVLPQPAAFWKRSLFERVGYLNESFQFVMDREFMCRAVQVAHHKHIKKFTAMFRYHRDQKTQTIGHIGREESALILERYGAIACGKFPPILVKMACYLVKTVFFIMDGELCWVLGAILRKLHLSSGPVHSRLC